VKRVTTSICIEPICLGGVTPPTEALGQRDSRGDHWKRAASPRKEVSSVSEYVDRTTGETMSRRGRAVEMETSAPNTQALGWEVGVTVAWLGTVPLVAMGWAGTILEVGVWMMLLPGLGKLDRLSDLEIERTRSSDWAVPLRNVPSRIQNGKLSRSEKLGSAWNVLRPGDSSLKRN
jgi:hypothetical protein